jgi:hypothetical protein
VVAECIAQRRPAHPAIVARDGSTIQDKDERMHLSFALMSAFLCTRNLQTPT